MASILKPLHEEKTEHLIWFVQHGFHQFEDHRQLAKKELQARGVKTKGLTHACICKRCVAKKEAKKK